MDITELQRAGAVKNINRHPWELARTRLIHFLIRKYLPRPVHLADIGSGDAFLLKSLAGENIAARYSSVDTAYTPAILEQLQADDKAPITYHNDTTSLANAPADTVLLLDVLEHCADDAAVLRSLVEQSTTANARFFITVPAFQSLFAGHDTLLLHYRRYNRKQLVALCRAQGLEIERSGYFFFVLLFPRLWQLAMEKMHLRKANTSIDNWKANKLITRLFYVILWADFRIGYALSSSGLQIPGLSCYCICRKSPS